MVVVVGVGVLVEIVVVEEVSEVTVEVSVDSAVVGCQLGEEGRVGSGKGRVLRFNIHLTLLMQRQ